MEMMEDEKMAVRCVTQQDAVKQKRLNGMS